MIFKYEENPDGSRGDEACGKKPVLAQEVELLAHHGCPAMKTTAATTAAEAHNR